MEKIKQYRLLCSLGSPLRPYQKSSPEQILFTSRKIRIKLNKKGGKNDIETNPLILITINEYSDSE